MKRVGAIFLFITLLIVFPHYPEVFADGNNASNQSISPGNLDSAKFELINGYLDSIVKSLNILANKNDAASWAVAIVALLVGLAGIFGVQELIKDLRIKPGLLVTIKQEPPDCLKIPVTNQLTGQLLHDTYYLRFRIENSGNYRLEDAEVVALEVQRRGNNGRYSPINSFLPMNLKWSNDGRLTMPKIQPKLFKHCDFGHIVQSQIVNTQLVAFGLATTSNVVFIMDTEVTPNTGCNFFLPGEYKMKIAIAANNLSPQYYWYKLRISDVWDNNEQRMLTNNISVVRA